MLHKRKNSRNLKLKNILLMQVDLSDNEEEDAMGKKEERRMPVYSKEDIRFVSPPPIII